MSSAIELALVDWMRADTARAGNALQWVPGYEPEDSIDAVWSGPERR